MALIKNSILLPSLWNSSSSNNNSKLNRCRLIRTEANRNRSSFSILVLGTGLVCFASLIFCTVHSASIEDKSSFSPSRPATISETVNAETAPESVQSVQKRSVHQSSVALKPYQHSIMRFGRAPHNIMHFGKRAMPANGNNIMHFGKRASDYDSNIMHFGKRASDYDSNIMHFGKRASDYDSNIMHFGKRPSDYGSNIMHFGKRGNDVDSNFMHFGKRPSNFDSNIMHFGKRPSDFDSNIMHFGKRPSDFDSNIMHFGKRYSTNSDSEQSNGENEDFDDYQLQTNGANDGQQQSLNQWELQNSRYFLVPLPSNADLDLGLLSSSPSFSSLASSSSLPGLSLPLSDYQPKLQTLSKKASDGSHKNANSFMHFG